MTAAGSQRLDKWLFFARVVKTRALASKLIQAGRVRINGLRVEQPSAAVRPADMLTITMERRILVYRVVETGLRRGPAPEAQLLYEDLSPAAAGTDAPPDELPSFRTRPRS